MMPVFAAPALAPESSNSLESSRVTGRFITFEGGEGSGKTTQLSLLAQKLRNRGLPLITTREPGGCPMAEQIRSWLVTGKPEAIASKTEFLLVLAARIEHVRQVIHPALQQGTWVLCDRFIDSTMAYQGYGRGMDLDMLRYLHNWVWEGEPVLHPDLTFLLDVPPVMGLARAQPNRQVGDVSTVTEDRFEQETLAFHQRVQRGFHVLAQAAPERFRVIDATFDALYVENNVWEVVCDVFPNI